MTTTDSSTRPRRRTEIPEYIAVKAAAKAAGVAEANARSDFAAAIRDGGDYTLAMIAEEILARYGYPTAADTDGQRGSISQLLTTAASFRNAYATADAARRVWSELADQLADQGIR